MEDRTIDLERWCNIVGSLTGIPPFSVALRPSQYMKSTACRVEVLAKPSSITATISWRDPTGCRYDEQSWRRGMSKFSGTCALTGSPIRSGDEIYRPEPMLRTPLNAAQMILAQAIRHIDAED